MATRQLQFIISMIEDMYEEDSYYSIAGTISHIQSETAITDYHTLHAYLKRKQGPPTGQISRVVSKRLFDYLSHSNEDLSDILQNASKLYNCSPKELSDDKLCRYLSTQ